MKDVKRDFPGYPTDGSYLDTATMGLQPEVSIREQMDFITNSNYTVRKSLHERARLSENAYYEAKEKIAAFMGVREDQVAWVHNADLASNLVIHSFLEKFDETKPKFITSIFEHHSILAPLLSLRKKGKIRLELLYTNEEPCIAEYIEENGEEQDIIILGHTTQTLGLYRDIETIIKMTNDIGAITIFDFSRTAGQTEMRVNDLKIDVAICDGSIDLLGPVSGGFMTIRSDLINELQNPFPSSGNVGKVTKKKANQIKNIEKFEIGAPAISSLVGLKSSLNYLGNLGMDSIISHRKNIQKYLIKQIKERETINLIDPFFDDMYDNKRRSSIITLKGEFHSHDVALFLDEGYNVQVRSGLLCSHPGVTELGLEEVIQISTHVYNTKDDIDQLMHGLDEIFKIMG